MSAVKVATKVVESIGGGAVVLMQVLEMDERLRDAGVLYYPSDDCSLICRSWSVPDLEEDCIFLRGEDVEDDDNVGCLKFDTVNEAWEYQRKVEVTVDMVNEKYRLGGTFRRSIDGWVIQGD